MPTNKRTANTMYVLRWLHLRSRLAPQKSRSCARSGLYLFTLLVRLRREDSDAISQLTGHDAGASIYTVLHVMKILTAGTAERAQLYGQVFYVQLPVAQWLHRKRKKKLTNWKQEHRNWRRRRVINAQVVSSPPTSPLYTEVVVSRCYHIPLQELHLLMIPVPCTMGRITYFQR